jgi:8-oxo-dGTP pyrophosphatase MutT (NUDIX family)
MNRQDSSPERSASAARRPTGDPRRFLIPTSELPPGFADRVGAGDTATKPRAAATVVVTRDAAGGLEVLLVRRPRSSLFAGGAWVFPGGVVDQDDAKVAIATLTPRERQAWAQRLDVEDPARGAAFAVAAIREAWEETGIFLADSPPEAGTSWMQSTRRDLLSGADSFAAIINRHELRLRHRELIYIAHWITPEPERRRYDARFFLARVPDDACCELEGSELSDARWVRPADALAAFGAGRLTLLPPTAHTLHRLAAHESLDELCAELRDAPVPAHLPTMRLDPEGVVIEI